jgi:hypothetical protein
MALKNLLFKKLLFFDGNVKFGDFLLDKEIEIWRLYIELDIDQKDKTNFKANVRWANKGEKDSVKTEVFEFDDVSRIRKIIYGNPFEKSSDLINHIIFEFYDHKEHPLVYMWAYVYEIGEYEREDLYPFSTTK